MLGVVLLMPQLLGPIAGRSLELATGRLGQLGNRSRSSSDWARGPRCTVTSVSAGLYPLAANAKLSSRYSVR